MNFTRIIIKKTFTPKQTYTFFPSHASDNIYKFHTNFNKTLRKSHGCVKSDSFVFHNNYEYNKIITISDWDSVKNWKKWDNSIEKKILLEEYNNLFDIEIHADVLLKYDAIYTPLL